MKLQRIIDKFTNIAVKLGSQVHLRSLRDAFAVIMPLFILAGIATLFNSVIFTWLFTGETLEQVKHWGTAISNGTLNISGLLVAPMIAYYLAKNKDFENPIAATVVAMAALVIMMPTNVSVVPVGAEKAVTVTGVLTYANLGTKAMFAGIFIGLFVTEIFMYLSSVKRLKINLGENVPPAVSNSFVVLIPSIIVLSLMALLSLVLNIYNTNLIALISTLVQEPLRKMNTSLLGCIFIYSCGNFLFTLGIHQSVINKPLLEPLLLANLSENMLAFATGTAIPYIINYSLVNTFGMIGGTGSTLSLIIATLIFGKLKSTKNIARLATAPGLFNINEPVIFGYPIVFNLPMMIPFVLLPAFGITVAYFATKLGLMGYCVVNIPWTTPPLISAYLATAGDWRAVIVQLLIIVGGALLYLPFMKINEKVSEQQSNEIKREAE